MPKFIENYRGVEILFNDSGERLFFHRMLDFTGLGKILDEAFGSGDFLKDQVLPKKRFTLTIEPNVFYFTKTPEGKEIFQTNLTLKDIRRAIDFMLDGECHLANRTCEKIRQNYFEDKYNWFVNSTIALIPEDRLIDQYCRILRDEKNKL